MSINRDGRNLAGGTNGRTLNEDLRIVLPPLPYLFSAAGFMLFGVNEFGARIVPALFGWFSLALLFGLLRQRLPENPRFVFFVFLLSAWSAQLLLFFRQANYYSFMVFAVIASFYLYERFWRTRRYRFLAALTFVAIVAFFNHYTGGAATVLALAAWHVLIRARKTAGREWLALGGCALLVAACGGAYLIFIGILGGERSSFLEFTGVTGVGEDRGAIPLVLLRIWIYGRELFTADWISWPVFLWFAGISAMMAYRGRFRDRLPSSSRKRRLPSRQRGKAALLARNSRETATIAAGSLPIVATQRIVLMGVLFALFSAILSVQPVWAHDVADLRYYVGALPLLLAMKGLICEWAWRNSKFAGGALLAVLLLSSAGAAPINAVNHFTGQRTLGFHLFSFVDEIRQNYRDSTRVVSDFMLENSEQDDTVYVSGFADREALTFAIGHRVLFCCVLDQNSPLPRERIGQLRLSLSSGGGAPDWILVFGPLQVDYWNRISEHYSIASALDVLPYPTQRPEINFHVFEPIPYEAGVYVLRKKTSP
ncbi:MAG: glycosyltransferase family 39 protein [Albidovulum sp.]|nr:glycosyltransferase family 39 protein [Albidovulum sp.]